MTLGTAVCSGMALVESFGTKYDCTVLMPPNFLGTASLYLVSDGNIETAKVATAGETAASRWIGLQIS